MMARPFTVDASAGRRSQGRVSVGPGVGVFELDGGGQQEVFPAVAGDELHADGEPFAGGSEGEADGGLAGEVAPAAQRQGGQPGLDSGEGVVVVGGLEGAQRGGRAIGGGHKQEVVAGLVPVGDGPADQLAALQEV